MAAPKGNQYAKGHGCGRFRTVCPSDEELVVLGEELVEWVRQNNPVHICEWYQFEKDITDNCWEVMIQKEVFLAYYKKALKMIGLNYLKEDTGIEPNVKNRWLRLYWKDLRKQEDQDKDDDIARQRQLGETVDEEQIKQMEALLSQLKSSRNKAINSNKSE